jgi:hypothetical protein
MGEALVAMLMVLEPRRLPVGMRGSRLLAIGISQNLSYYLGFRQRSYTQNWRPAVS